MIQTNDKNCEILNGIARTSQVGDLESLVHKFQAPGSPASNRLDSENELVKQTIYFPKSSNKFARQSYDTDKGLSTERKDVCHISVNKIINSRNAPIGGVRTERSPNPRARGLNHKRNSFQCTLDSNGLKKDLKKDLVKNKANNDHTKAYIKNMNKKTIIPSQKEPDLAANNIK